MAVTLTTRDDMPGAYCSVEAYRQRGHVDVYRTIYEGAVLADREYNGYDDSDFYAIVWDEEQQCCRRIEYATTRYSSGGSCRVDATEDIRAKAAYWGACVRRRNALQCRWDKRRAWIEERKRCGLATYWPIKRLYDAYPRNGDLLDEVIKLLATKKFKSEIRLSMAQQVRSWLADPDPKYPTPLSPKQVEILTRHLPVRNSTYIPTGGYASLEALV